MAMNSNYDIAIIGGGMVGASLACCLAQHTTLHSKKVVVLEAFDDSGSDLQPSYDARSTAVSYGSKGIFEKISCWQELGDKASPIHKIHISDKGHFGSVLLDSDEYSQEAFGYVLENKEIGKVLLNRIKEHGENIHWLSPAIVKKIKVKQNNSELDISCAQEKHKIQADLVVLADGGRSSLCQSLGIDHHVSPYQQCAVITNVSTDKCHDNQAYERFTSQGPMALLPLKPLNIAGSNNSHSSQQYSMQQLPPQRGLPQQHRFGLVWTVPQEKSSELMSMTDKEFICHLQKQFGYRAGKFIKAGKRYAYPLNLIKAAEQVRPGLAVLGNAAHTLHPVAGQGFNLALRDVTALTEALSNGLSKGLSPGDIRVLNDYVKRQQQDQEVTVLFSDYLVRLFSSHSRLLSLVRKFGMMAIDLFGTVQADFNSLASGKYFRESQIL